MPIQSEAPYAPFARSTETATNGSIKAGNLSSFFSKEISTYRKNANQTSQVVASGEESVSKWNGSLIKTIPYKTKTLIKAWVRLLMRMYTHDQTVDPTINASSIPSNPLLDRDKGSSLASRVINPDAAKESQWYLRGLPNKAMFSNGPQPNTEFAQDSRGIDSPPAPNK